MATILIPPIDLPNELWKVIEGFDGEYFVSNLGRIKSVKKKYKTWAGSAAYKNDRIIKQTGGNIESKTDWGLYLNCALTKDQKQSGYLVHRIVAKAFIPNPENKPFINHKNGIRTDNRVENLEWCSRSENAKHSFLIGTQTNKGENHPRAKITNEIVLEIRSKYTPRQYSFNRLAREYGISKKTVIQIVHKETWSHI